MRHVVQERTATDRRVPKWSCADPQETAQNRTKPRPVTALWTTLSGFESHRCRTLLRDRPKGNGCLQGWRRQSSRGILPAPGGARREHRAGTLAVSGLAGRYCRIVTGDTYFAVSGQTLYAINLTTGRDLWPPVEARAPIDGRERAVGIAGLVDAGAVLVGVTPASLMAFDKATGRLAWQVPGQYRQSSPSTAVAGGVLYVQVTRARSPPPRCRVESSTREASPWSRRRRCRADT
jgi:PQQ-like domain